MEQGCYWLDLFTPKTWEEFSQAGGRVSGFSENRWSTVKKVRPGDRLLCYLTGASRFVGVLEVVSDPFKDDSQIWEDSLFPCRVKVEPVVRVAPEHGVPIAELEGLLSFLPKGNKSNAWTGHVRGSPTKWKEADGEAVLKALMSAARNPVKRPISERKLKYRPRLFKAKIGQVTVPESEGGCADEPVLDEKKPREHTEIQWLLLELGSNMGFDVWVARNDKGRQWNGNRFEHMPKLRNDLPKQFDDATNKTIELIDVLWLQGNTIVAAFEVESTTSIYSGLLRMSDLVAMQPNLKMPLYLVAPDERREKVFDEIQRPTFSRLNPPLSEICRFISFDALRRKVESATGFLKYLRPEFLDSVSETCRSDTR